MQDFTIADWIRSLLIVMCFVVLIGLVLRARVKWAMWGAADKWLISGVMLLIIANGARSYIAIQASDGFVWPLWLFLGSLACFAIYLTQPKSNNRW